MGRIAAWPQPILRLADTAVGVMVGVPAVWITNRFNATASDVARWLDAIKTTRFRFLGPRTRLDAISQLSAMVGRRKVARRADFGELNTQELILCELLKKSTQKCEAKVAPILTISGSDR